MDQNSSPRGCLVLFWAAIGVLLLIGAFAARTSPEPGRIRREAKDRLDKEVDQMMELEREMKIRMEMEEQRRKRGW